MNLLIIGAGGHGRVVKEVAVAMSMYNRIDYLDDYLDVAIGKFDEYTNFKNEYEYAFVAIGSNELRSKWVEKLIEAGYKIPVLIHPTAYQSQMVKIESGVVVLPKAAIHTNVVIKQGSIIGMGSLVDHDVIIDEFCHINTGAIVKANCKVNTYTKLDAGEVYSGEQINK